MTDTPLKNHVIFYSRLFSCDFPEDPSTIDRAPPWGKDSAEFFIKALRGYEGIETDAEPYRGEDGWLVDVKVRDERYELDIFWIPFEEHEQYVWAIGIDERLTLFSFLFKPKTLHFKHLLNLIANILDQTDGIRDVRWMTEEEFEKIY